MPPWTGFGSLAMAKNGDIFIHFHDNIGWIHSLNHTTVGLCISLVNVIFCLIFQWTNLYYSVQLGDIIHVRTTQESIIIQIAWQFHRLFGFIVHVSFVSEHLASVMKFVCCSFWRMMAPMWEQSCSKLFLCSRTFNSNFHTRKSPQKTATTTFQKA